METKAQSLKGKSNVSTVERLLMIASGAYILYNGLNQKHKRFTQSGVGGAMLLRGISGYCPVYDAVDHLKKDKTHNVNI